MSMQRHALPKELPALTCLCQVTYKAA